MGALEHGDSIGQMEGLKDTAMCQRPPFVQSEKRAAEGGSARVKLACGRLILHYDRHIVHAASESRRDVA